MFMPDTPEGRKIIEILEKHCNATSLRSLVPITMTITQIKFAGKGKMVYLTGSNGEFIRIEAKKSLFVDLWWIQAIERLPKTVRFERVGNKFKMTILDETKKKKGVKDIELFR